MTIGSITISTTQSSPTEILGQVVNKSLVIITITFTAASVTVFLAFSAGDISAGNAHGDNLIPLASDSSQLTTTLVFPNFIGQIWAYSATAGQTANVAITGPEKAFIYF